MKVRKEQDWKQELSKQMAGFEKRFLGALKAGFSEQDERMGQKFAEQDNKINKLEQHMTEGFARQDKRFVEQDNKISSLDKHMREGFARQDRKFIEQDNKINKLEQRVDKGFVDQGRKIDLLAEGLVTYFYTKEEINTKFAMKNELHDAVESLKSYIGVQVESLKSDFRAGLELAMHHTSLIDNHEVRIKKLEQTVTF